MTPQDKIDRIWCDVYARSFVLLTRPEGIYHGYTPSEACEEARRLADAAVSGMEAAAPQKRHHVYIKCPECKGAGLTGSGDTCVKCSGLCRVYMGHHPEDCSCAACGQLRADSAVLRPGEPCAHCNGTGEAPATGTGNPAGERTYGDCSECGGTGRDS